MVLVITILVMKNGIEPGKVLAVCIETAAILLLNLRVMGKMLPFPCIANDAREVQ